MTMVKRLIGWWKATHGRLVVAGLLTAVTLGTGLWYLTGGNSPRATSSRPSSQSDELATLGGPRTDEPSAGADPSRTSPQDRGASLPEQTSPDLDKDPDGPYDEPPLSSIRGMDEVSWEEALAWWPHRPLYRAPQPPGRAPNEAIFVKSDRGRKGNPDEELAGVDILYWSDRVSIDSHSTTQIIAAGGIKVTVLYWPAAMYHPTDYNLHRYTPVTVRGRQAWLKESREGQQSNVTYRLVNWEDPGPRGGMLQWVIENHPDAYTAEETLAFIEALREFR